jgi:hypothetical protein
MANQPPSTEIDNWGEPTDAAKQKDALIRELVAALAGASGGFLTGTTVSCNVEAALAKAKAAGYAPAKTTDEHPYSRDKLGEDC